MITSTGHVVVLITSATVVRQRYGTDTVFLNTDYSSTLYAARTTTFKCEQARGQGPKWVKDTFGIEARLIEEKIEESDD